jgi:hypothetical protein
MRVFLEEARKPARPGYRSALARVALVIYLPLTPNNSEAHCGAAVASRSIRFATSPFGKFGQRSQRPSPMPTPFQGRVHHMRPLR